MLASQVFIKGQMDVINVLIDFKGVHELKVSRIDHSIILPACCKQGG